MLLATLAMAGTAARREKSDKKGKKRKLTTPESTKTKSKLARNKNGREKDGCDIEEREKPANMEVHEETRLKNEEGRQWRNLELVLSIQSKDFNSLKKLELIFNFVNSRANKEDNATEQDFNVLNMSRTITYISSWIQSLLISSERKLRAGDKESEESQLCLDYRCWEVLKFCLEESVRLQVSLSISRDLLKVISCVATSALNWIKSVHTDINESIFTTVEFQFYSTVSDCMRILFSSHGRMLNGNLDLWTVAVSSLIEVVIKIYKDNLQDSGVGILIIQFSCLTFDPFAKFLRVHQGRKNGFRDFVDKLLEPLLHLLGVLHDQIRDSCHVSRGNLFNLVEEILSYGLFHSVNLDEYLNFHSAEKYGSSADGKLEIARTIITSYHRRFFDRLENLISERKVQALTGIGEVFRLFVDRVRKQERDSVDAKNSLVMESESTKHVGNPTSEKSNHMNTPCLNVRKSIFDFFVLTLEPLLLDLKKQLQSDLDSETSLLDVYYLLKSVNKIVSIMMRERVYVRSEGDFGEACLNFFKIIYRLVLSCYAKFNQLWQSSVMDRFPQVEILNSLAKEFILLVESFLEIEYEVIGDDLVSIWLMILSFLAVGHSSEDASLLSGTVDLGCRVLGLYSELRQVNHAVFSLCRGLRHLSFYEGDDEIKYSEQLTSNSTLHYDKFAKSSHMLLCSQKFRLAICNAIKSIPEGQVSGCVQTLTEDISNSLAWMKVSCSVRDDHEFGEANSSRFTAQAELLGMILSEIYSIVIDSLSVTTGNSYLMGVSTKNLIEVLRPSMIHLIAPKQDSTDEFLFSVTGVTFQSNKVECRNYLHDKIPLVILFFFHLYASCQSLYRQAVSLMPPDSSRKMSDLMADFYTAYSGQDCMERADFEDEGYFSWIGQPSASLLSVTQTIKDSFLQQGSVDYSCLIYVMHIMAFQRLVDLNRQIRSVDYILQRSQSVIHNKLKGDADLLILHSNTINQEKFLSDLKEEAVGLTDFIMEYLSSVDDKQLSVKLSENTTSSSPQDMKFEAWDLGICTVNEKTLPTAIWYIICQNIDICCNYATKKKVKLFLSLLIVNSLPYGSCGELEKHLLNGPGAGMKVTKHQIAQEHLHDTNLYDQKFVCRYMASRLCNILKKCASLLFKDSANIDAEWSSTDWENVLSELNNSYIAARDKPLTSHCTYSVLMEGSCNKISSSSSISLHIAACRSLLDLLCHIMERSLSFKSFSCCMKHLVNFERLLIGSLVDPNGTLCLHEHLELLGLLVSCRRALKYLFMSFFEEKSEASKSSDLGTFSGSSSPTLWVSKSVNLVVAWWKTLSSEHNGGQVNDKIFSLMDHTSYMLFTLCKHLFGLVIQSTLTPRSVRKSCPDCKGNHSNESDSCIKLLKDVEACKSMINVVEMLEEQTKSFLPSLKELCSCGSMDAGVQLSDLNKLWSVVTCVQGFLWGLESALKDVGGSGNDLKAKLMKHNRKTISGINNFVEVFVEFLGISAQIFLRSDQPLKTSCDGQEQLKLDPDNSVLETEASLKEGPNHESESDDENQDGNLGSEKMSLASSDAHIDFDTVCRKERSQSANAESCIGGLTEFGSFNYNCLNIDMLQSLLIGQNPDAAFFLRGMLIASSAIVRLSVQIGCTPLPSKLIQIFVGCSETLLLKFSAMDDVPEPMSFVWLDGPLKFLEALGNQISSTNPATTRDVYTKLVELHLKAIGRCLCLQGKGANLASHDIESSAKISSQGRVSELTVSNSIYGLDELKARLRMSFKVFIEKPSELHLLYAIQALERALVGVKESCTTMYEVKMESAYGGTVSSLVAAGVDCLDSILEFVKGHKRLNLVGRNIHGLVASLFNIIIHLRGPTIFYKKPVNVAVNKNPDSGSVVAMCVEVLTRVAGKHAIFRLNSYHVGQSLYLPATLFQGFHNLREGDSSHPSLSVMDSKEYEHLKKCFLVDRQFSMNLYAASCRLLWTVVKHHKSECVRCIALLQNSLQVLLHCLEIVNADSADRKGYFTWQLEEGVKCASYLRRVYEEIRQQKDVLGRHCFMFLSDYIWLYSGHGPLKRGIRREVDEALRSGVYALIDVCSPDDLQYLHTVFGEGPCRSTLASLQHDYKLHFQYEGKV